MPILEANGLVKKYGRRTVVDGVSLAVDPGEIVGLLGPNGAGKTTSFKMMCGLVKPDNGRVILQGTDVTRWPLHDRSRSGGMGYLPQQSSVFAKLTTEENLKGMMQLLGFSRSQQKLRCNELLAQFKIEKIRKSKAGTLSGGERRRLEIARCLVAEPKIIMLDEPFAGIDPVTVQSIQVVITDLAKAGIAVLITDHAAREILQVTDRTYVVSEGRILCSGTAEEIVAHEEVKKKYLGEIGMPNINASTQAAVVSRKENTREPSSPPNQVGRESAEAIATPSQPSIASIKIPAESEILSMVDAVNQAIDQSASGEKKESDRPKIVFSKPRRSTRKVVSPFKSNDLD